MSLTRAYEEQEVVPELRRLYSDVRLTFDLPFVPTIFKLTAPIPEYLKAMWSDLGSVARSREFQTAGKGLEEFIHSQTVSNGWCFSDQERVLAGQRFSVSDIEQISAVVGIFVRAVPRLLLFSRLMQRGYSGGQPGRVSDVKQASALARLVTLHVPNEKEASMRVWLIYNDIRKTLGTRSVMSMYRVISPFPGYLASVWADSKKLAADPAFLRARDAVAKRTLGLMHGLPVKDHRAAAKHVTAEQWRDIEELVDGFVRVLPQFALLATVWQRSFRRSAGSMLAA